MAGVIAGAAEIAYTRRPDPGSTTADLLAAAASAAVRDAGLELGDVDGFGVSSFMLAPDRAIDLAWRLGLRLSWIMDDGNGGAAALSLLQHALGAIEAGSAKTILLVAGGVSSPAAFGKLVDNYNSATRDHLAAIPHAGPNSLFALVTQRHMQAHGLERSDYGRVAIAQRAWAALNPGAVYRSPMTMDDYLAAPIVAEPLGLYDCVPVVSGANAVVITRAARDRAVGIRAIRCTYNEDLQEGDGLRTGLARIANGFWTDADMQPDEVDAAAVYDDYPVMVLVQLADLGLVPAGGLRRFLDMRLGEERWPLNTSGGMLSAGQASGAGGMHGLVEMVTQLRGEAGERQVAECRTAVVTGYGMVVYRYGACASVALLERL
jgi:acetyl-CoA acetyltransferase